MGSEGQEQNRTPLFVDGLGGAELLVRGRWAEPKKGRRHLRDGRHLSLKSEEISPRGASAMTITVLGSGGRGLVWMDLKRRKPTSIANPMFGVLSWTLSLVLHDTWA